MRFFRSIRWRLQLWHGVMLALVLTGFGVTAWRLERATQFQRVDQELERHVGAIANAMRRDGGPADRPAQDPPPQDRAPRDQPPGTRPPQNRPPQDRPPQDQPPRDGPPRDRPPQDQPPRDRPPQDQPAPIKPQQPPGPAGVRLPPREASLFEGAPGSAFYYVAWDSAGRELSRSASAPSDVPHPEPAAGARDQRSRGTLREFIHFTPTGDCIVVGRDMGDELSAMRRFALLLAFAGCAVFVLGLAGGWWISTRALRPVADISATAAKISNGDLAQRIPVADTGSELGDLARVLNDTFARLHASFARQAQFTADASHELRTPLSVVLTQAQTALARERSAAEYRESLTACQGAAQRMRRLITSLLTLARLDSGETAATRSPCDLGAVAGEAVALAGPEAQQRGITIVTDLSPAVCDGNAEELGAVAANLISNAIYYNRPGGSVQVSTATEPGAAVLSVSDTGEGVTPEDLPHIFERFYRADKARSNAGGHVGLGLAIAKAIVDAHGGIIRVASEAGQGSTFTVRLPAGPAPHA
jgi:two-component system, OmpR family, sensor kinase